MKKVPRQLHVIISLKCATAVDVYSVSPTTCEYSLNTFENGSYQIHSIWKKGIKDGRYMTIWKIYDNWVQPHRATFDFTVIFKWTRKTIIWQHSMRVNSCECINNAKINSSML